MSSGSSRCCGFGLRLGDGETGRYGDGRPFSPSPGSNWQHQGLYVKLRIFAQKGIPWKWVWGVPGNGYGIFDLGWGFLGRGWRCGLKGLI